MKWDMLFKLSKKVIQSEPLETFSSWEM